MKNIHNYFPFIIFLLLLSFKFEVLSQENSSRSFVTYRELSAYQHTSPGAFRTGLYGYDNPSLLSYSNSTAELMFAFNNPGFNNMNFSNWGLFYQNYSGSALGMIRSVRDSHSVIDYRYSLGFGDKNFAFGLNYGFTGGDKGYFNRSNTLGWGFMLRPSRFFSFTLSQTFALESGHKDAETVVDVAVRPIPNYLVTFFADYVVDHNKKMQDGNWSAGVNWEFLDGIRLTGRYFDTKKFSVSLDFSLRYFGIGNITNMAKSNEINSTTSYIKLGGPDRSILSSLFNTKKWATLKLSDGLSYMNSWFSGSSVTFFNLISKIDEAKKDKNIKGLLIDARQMSLAIEKTWELREKLTEFKEAGKKIIVYLERASFPTYYFATIADKIILDPLGTVSLKGPSISQSYYKSFFEKFGIGFEEIRLYKYKSAYENFARDEMSEGDKEQRQRLLDEWYNTLKNGIAKGRNLPVNKVEEISDSKIFFSANDLVKAGLIDTLSRWDDRSKLYDYFDSESPNQTQVVSNNKEIVRTENPLFSRKEIEPFDNKWSSSEKSIAIFYLDGPCSMEGGIDARKNAKILQSILDNKNVKAVVLRVDSPGGDALASDYFAELVRKYKDKKPIIVSQGSYAASGGYWLSMDADRIFSSPFTLTGSIGVISMWIYDKGLSEDLKIKNEVLKTNKYSDFGSSWSLPLIGIGLPSRNLNDDERKQYDNSIDDIYKEFVNKVSKGRNSTYDEIHKVAQGRVWTGNDAKSHKLVDEIGTLWSALEHAASKANISLEDKDLNIYEYPKASFSLSSLIENLLGMKSIENEKKSEFEKILYRLKNNQKIMHLIPSEYEELIDNTK